MGNWVNALQGRKGLLELVRQTAACVWREVALSKGYHELELGFLPEPNLPLFLYFRPPFSKFFASDIRVPIIHSPTF